MFPCPPSASNFLKRMGSAGRLYLATVLYIAQLPLKSESGLPAVCFSGQSWYIAQLSHQCNMGIVSRMNARLIGDTEFGKLRTSHLSWPVYQQLCMHSRTHPL